MVGKVGKGKDKGLAVPKLRLSSEAVSRQSQLEQEQTSTEQSQELF